MATRNIEPTEAARWLAERAIILVDVREPEEYALERIPGALLFPLSSFDPAALQAVGDRKIVFQCGSGLRSAKALAAADDAGLACAGHVAGGIKAWKEAGLPVIAVDPGTGKLRGSR